MVYLSLDFLVSTHKQQQDSQNPKGEFKKKKEDGDHVHMVAWQREEPLPDCSPEERSRAHRHTVNDIPFIFS